MVRNFEVWILNWLKLGVGCGGSAGKDHQRLQILRTWTWTSWRGSLWSIKKPLCILTSLPDLLLIRRNAKLLILRVLPLRKQGPMVYFLSGFIYLFETRSYSVVRPDLNLKQSSWSSQILRLQVWDTVHENMFLKSTQGSY